MTHSKPHTDCVDAFAKLRPYPTQFENAFAAYLCQYGFAAQEVIDELKAFYARLHHNEIKHRFGRELSPADWAIALKMLACGESYDKIIEELNALLISAELKETGPSIDSSNTPTL
jgi:hypothetical protein